MKNTLKFKTNMKCEGCKNQIKPFLNDSKAITHWEVDLSHPDKVLTIETTDNVNQTIALIEKAGFEAQPLK